MESCNHWCHNTPHKWLVIFINVCVCMSFIASSWWLWTEVIPFCRGRERERERINYVNSHNNQKVHWNGKSFITWDRYFRAMAKVGSHQKSWRDTIITSFNSLHCIILCVWQLGNNLLRVTELKRMPNTLKIQALVFNSHLSRSAPCALVTHFSVANFADENLIMRLANIFPYM